MYRASDYRSLARSSLKGNWAVAVIAGLIAFLLGSVAVNGPQLGLQFQNGKFNFQLSLGQQQMFSFQTVLSPEFREIILSGAIFLILLTIVLVGLMFFLSSVIRLGYCKFNLELVDTQTPQLNTLFGYFRHWKTAVCADLLKALYVFLWSLLLLIPGIMASYSYAMTGYILAENPWMTASEAIAQSKQLMRGNRWRLFCLEFSFIGWNLLAALSLGIGNLWLMPYQQASIAAFYRDISCQTTFEQPTPPTF